jgi:hypothetical protein
VKGYVGFAGSRREAAAGNTNGAKNAKITSSRIKTYFASGASGASDTFLKTVVVPFVRFVIFV